MNTFQNYGAILMTDLHFLVIVRLHIITRQSIIINLDITLHLFRHPDTTIGTSAQVPSDSVDRGSSAQSCARLNWTTSNASQHRSLSDQKTPGALLTPPQLEVFHHTTDKATPPSVLSEPSLSTESSCMLRGLDPVAQVTRRLIEDRYFRRPVARRRAYLDSRDSS